MENSYSITIRIRFAFPVKFKSQFYVEFYVSTLFLLEIAENEPQPFYIMHTNSTYTYNHLFEETLKYINEYIKKISNSNINEKKKLQIW